MTGEYEPASLLSHFGSCELSALAEEAPANSCVQPTRGGFENETALESVGQEGQEGHGRVTWRKAAQREGTKKECDLRRDSKAYTPGRTLLAWVAGCDSRSL